MFAVEILIFVVILGGLIGYLVGKYLAIQKSFLIERSEEKIDSLEQRVLRLQAQVELRRRKD